MGQYFLFECLTRPPCGTEAGTIDGAAKNKDTLRSKEDVLLCRGSRITRFAREPGEGNLKEKNHNTPCCFSVPQVLQKQASDDPINEKTTPPAARWFFSSVGVAGFEPATPWSQTRCANRTALYPEFRGANVAIILVNIISLYYGVANLSGTVCTNY